MHVMSSPTRPAGAAHVTVPDTRGRLCRQRLLRRLGNRCGQPAAVAVWIGALSGMGKTTLAASHAAAAAASVWLRLDAGDSNPDKLLRHLHEACAQGQGVRQGRAPTASALAPPNAAPPLWREQVRALFAALPAGAVLVLDGVQAVDETRIGPLLAELVDEVRADQCLLLLSRRPPPAALLSQQVAGRLVRLPAAELAFDADEVRCWAVHHALPTPDDLLSASAGWPLAVDLLARGQGPDVVQQLLDQLLWPTLPPATQSVLLAAAWQPCLYADDAPPAALDGLAALTPFVERLGAAPPRWRLAQPFAILLQQRMRAQLGDAALASSLAATARRLQQHGDDVSAWALWCEAATLDAAHWQAAEAWLCRHAAAWLADGRHAQWRAAAELVPPESRSGVLWAGLAQAELTRDPAAARALADRALALLPADDVGRRVACLSLAIGSHFQTFGDTQPLAARVQALEAMGITAERHDAPAGERAAVAVAVWSALFLRQPAHPACSAWQARVMALLHEPVDPSLKLRATMLLAKQAWYSGRHGEMAALQPLMDGERVRPGSTPYARMLWHLARQYRTWSDTDWVRGRLDTRRALREADEQGVHLLDAHLQLHGACFASLDGDEAEAQALLGAVAAQADASRRMQAWHHYAVRAWLALRHGDDAAAESASRVAIEAASAMGPAPQAMALAIRCHALQGQGDVAALHGARRALGQLPLPPLPAAQPLVQVHTLFIDARTALEVGDSEGALGRLQRALAAVRSNALWAVFGAPPRAWARLLEQALRAGIEVDAARRMVGALRLDPPEDAGAEWPWPLRIRVDASPGAPPTIERDGQPLLFSGKPPKRPLALLRALVERGGRAPATLLADDLWPHADGDQALAAFEVALRRLRQLLPEPRVLSLSHGVLAIDRSRVWIDQGQAQTPLYVPGSQVVRAFAAS